MNTYRIRAVLLSALVACLLAAGSSRALVRLDFDQAFFVREGWQVWDFSVVRGAGRYHIFYHSRPEGASNSDPIRQIDHAVSDDLRHWEHLPPALTWDEREYQNLGMWAPHVVEDRSSGRWVMAYTAVDSLFVQRLCIAYSDDLHSWRPDPRNPVFAPDSLVYYWSPTTAWSSFRDPFLWREGGVWHVLNTAGLRVGGYPGEKRAIVHHATSTDLAVWTDAGVFFAHDGQAQWRDLESVQYVRRNGLHHLFFTEYGSQALGHVAAADPDDWTLAERHELDASAAAEVIAGPDADVLGRYVTYQHPLDGEFAFVARFDTLLWPSPDTPALHKPDPLARNWPVRSGTAVLGNPTFGDNPAERGDPPAGPRGNSYFSSQEYYRGPQSGVGAPGAQLGDFALGVLESGEYELEGDEVRLLVGGGDFPQTCYVALIDAETDTVIFRETGLGDELMTTRSWDVRALRGRRVKFRIVDDETAAGGHICVDDIEELPAAVAAASPPPPPVRVSAAPNPFNPRTEFRFALAGAADARVEVHDLRGRRLWTSPTRSRGAGPAVVIWDGRDIAGRDLPSGTYLFRLLLDDRPAAAGRVTLVR